MSVREGLPTLESLLASCVADYQAMPAQSGGPERLAARLLCGSPAQVVLRCVGGAVLVLSGEPKPDDQVLVRIFEHPAAPEAPVAAMDFDLLQDIIDAVPATISIKDHLRRYLFVNRAWERHYGLSRTEVVGRFFESLSPGDVSAETFGAHSGDVKTRDGMVLETGRPLLGDEEHFVDRAGRPRTLLSSKLPLLDGDGRPWAVLSITHDISAFKEAEEALREAKSQAEAANYAKSEFLSIVSHELRTPLNAILGFSELGSLVPPSHRTVGYFSMIARAGKTLCHVIDDILDLSQIELGRFQLEEAPLDLRSVINETADLMQPEIEAKGLILRVSVDDAVPATLLADGKRLRQVLLNLLNNAAKFTTSGSISLDCGLETAGTMAGSGEGGGGAAAGRPRLQIAVTDTGIGIPLDKQAEIFESFTQLETQTNRRYPGLGLGLSICKRLLLHMNGELGVHSAPGQGSRFWFRLPLRPPGSPCHPANDSRRTASDPKQATEEPAARRAPSGR
ncbi:MAG: PAS domain-containing protein [Alphaproteobacteria bacterium]|nr:PAS domain-containing protein [Alphaproteobacteria bacterium]